MAKTQYSFSDDPKLLGAPRDFVLTIRNLKVSAGAGFIVALTGDIMTMPGLPKVELTLEDVYAYGKEVNEPKQTSGKQELYEAILNMYC